MRPTSLAGVAIAIALAAVAVVAAAAAYGLPTEPGHTPMHIGCLHHNHGPKWHADHGRTLSQPASRYARPDREAAAGNKPNNELFTRSITSAR